MSARLPHRTLTSSPTLRVVRADVDGVPRPDLLEGHLRRIDLTDASIRWSDLATEVVVEAAPEDVMRFLDDGLTITCTTVAMCTATRLRQGVAMRPDPEVAGRWLGGISLTADDLHGKVELSGHVAADMDGRPARRLGRTDTWDVYVDEAARPPFQGTFQVKWSHFSGEARERSVPESASSESFFVDLTGGTPAIHLNKDMDGLHELLSGDDRRPDLEKALRDAEMRRIATAAWTSAIGAAAATIQVDTESGTHELPESAWRADVLRWSLPSIFPGASLEEALVRIRSDLRGEDAAVTQAMIQLTVSRHMKAGDLLKRTLRSTLPT